MRRRLVLSTIAVVVVVIVVLTVPVLLIVRDAEGGELRGDVVSRLVVIALAAIGAAALLAGVQARQLARPLERLARSASRLGDGDFSAAALQPSGIGEIDDIARSLRLSANRVDRMLESERGFTGDATHQLRTGLTGIAMRLELLERSSDTEVAAEAAAALAQTHDLNTTLDELLTVARTGSTKERTELDLTTLVDHQVADWQQRFAEKRRQVVVTTGVTQHVMATPGLVGQVLSVLLENSLRHGRGTVAILVQDSSVTMEDEGPGVAERSSRDAVRSTERPSSRSRPRPGTGAAPRRVGRRPPRTRAAQPADLPPHPRTRQDYNRGLTPVVIRRR